MGTALLPFIFGVILGAFLGFLITAVITIDAISSVRKEVNPLDKFVDYETYCPKCVHSKEDEWSESCDDCLDNPVSQDSRKPIHFEEKEPWRK